MDGYITMTTAAALEMAGRCENAIRQRRRFDKGVAVANLEKEAARINHEWWRLALAFIGVDIKPVTYIDVLDQQRKDMHWSWVRPFFDRIDDWYEDELKVATTLRRACTDSGVNGVLVSLEDYRSLTLWTNP